MPEPTDTKNPKPKDKVEDFLPSFDDDFLDAAEDEVLKARTTSDEKKTTSGEASDKPPPAFSSNELQTINGVRTELKMDAEKLPDATAREIARLKEVLKLQNYKEAADVLAVKGLGNFASGEKAHEHMLAHKITFEELEKIKKLGAEKKVPDADLGKLLKMSAIEREDLLFSFKKPSFSAKAVSVLLNCDSELREKALSKSSNFDAFGMLKDEAITEESLKAICRLTGDKVKQISVLGRLDATNQIEALKLKHTDFDRRTELIPVMEKNAPTAKTNEIANQIFSLGNPGANAIFEGINKKILESKDIIEILKITPPEYRDNIARLATRADNTLKNAQEFLTLRKKGNVSPESAKILSDVSYSGLIDGDSILKIARQEKPERDAVIKILGEHYSSELPVTSRLTQLGVNRLVDANFSADTLDGLRMKLLEGKLNDVTISQLSKQPQPNRQISADFLLKVSVDAASVSKITSNSIDPKLLSKLQTEHVAGRYSSENVNRLFATDLDVLLAVRDRLLAEHYDKNPLSNECLEAAFKAVPSKETLGALFKGLDQKLFPSQKELTDILNLPNEKFRTFEKAFVAGNLDAKAISILRTVDYDRDQVKKYAKAISECKAKGIEIGAVNETLEYLQYHHNEGSVPKLKSSSPAAEIELASLIALQKIDTTDSKAIASTQALYEKTATLRDSLKLSVSESITVQKFCDENKRFQFTEDMIEQARKVATRHPMEPLSFSKALGVVAIADEKTPQLSFDRIREAESRVDEVLSLARKHPDANIKTLYDLVGIKQEFEALADRKSAHEFKNIALTETSDPAFIAMQIDDFSKLRMKELDEKLRDSGYAHAKNELRAERSTWERVSLALQGDSTELASEIFSTQKDIAWKILTATTPDGLKALSIDRLADLTSSINSKRIETLEAPRKAEFLRDIVAEQARRLKGEIPESKRAEFIRSSIEAASQLPEVISARRPAVFNILQNLSKADLSKLSVEHLKQVANSFSTLQMESLPIERQARLVIDLLKVANEPGKKPFKEASYKKLISFLQPEMLDKISPDEIKGLSESLKRDLKSEKLLPEKTKTGDLASEIAQKISGKDIPIEHFKKLLDGISAEDRALALEILTERAKHLSQAGFIKQLKDLASELREQNFVLSKQVRNRTVEAVTLYSFSDSTSSKALAYQLKKHTGLQVDLQIIKPGEPIPSGKGLLIQPIGEAPPALQDQIRAAKNIHQATGIESFQRGLNFLHMASMGTNDTIPIKQLQTLVDAEKRAGRTAHDKTVQKESITEAQYESLTKQIHVANNEAQARTEAKTLLFFAHSQANHNGPRQLHALAINATLNVMTYSKMIEQAWMLNEKIIEQAKQTGLNPDKIFYIVDEKPNSNNIATELARTAIGKEGREHDGKFVTFEQAKAMDKTDATFIYLNDGIYSGSEAQKKMEKLKELKEAGGTKTRVVAASFIGYEGGVKATEEEGRKVGVDVMVDETYIEAGRDVLLKTDRAAISRVLNKSAKPGDPPAEFTLEQAKELIGDAEWRPAADKAGKTKGVEVVTAVFFPDVHSNTTGKLFTDLAGYVSVPRAHTENRAELIIDDIKSKFTDLNTVQNQKSALSSVFGAVRGRGITDYANAMNSLFKDFESEIKNNSDMALVLNEGLAKALSETPNLAASLNLEGKKVKVSFGDLPETKINDSGDTIEIVLETALAEKSAHSKASTEIMKRLLELRAENLRNEYPGVDPAKFKKTVDDVVADKTDKIEAALKKGNAISVSDQAAKIAGDITKSPMSEEKLRLFLERVERDLPAQEYLEELRRQSKEFFSNEGSEHFQNSVKRTAFKLDQDLKAGESRLKFSHADESFTPQKFEPEPHPGKFLSSEGKSYPLDKCRFEISIGATSTPQEAATAALVEFNRLNLKIQNAGSAEGGGGGAAFEKIALEGLRQQAATLRQGGGAIPATDGVASPGKTETYEFGEGKLVEITFSENGIKVGKSTYSEEELVKLMIDEKEKRLKDTKETAEREKLAKEIEVLKAHRQTATKDGVSPDLKDMLAKHLEGEISSQKQAKGPSAVAKTLEKVGKGSAYLMIVTFVAAMAANASAQEAPRYKPKHTPFTPGG